MDAPTIRTRRIVALAAAPLAIVVAGLLVWQGSSAAFTARTQNVGNNWETGSVTLTDDDAGVAAFSVQNATPGATGSRCLTVTSTSTVAGVVKPYVARLGAQGLENYIYIQMEQGTGGGFASCVGFVPEGTPLPAASLSYLSTANHDFATGAPRGRRPACRVSPGPIGSPGHSTPRDSPRPKSTPSRASPSAWTLCGSSRTVS